MKNILFVCTLSLFISSCIKVQNVAPPKITDEVKIQMMVKNYQILMNKTRDFTLQINMDQAELQNLIAGSNGVRFLFAANDSNIKESTTVILNLYDSLTQRSDYYDIGPNFKKLEGTTSMRGKPFLCPQPATCDVIFK